VVLVPELAGPLEDAETFRRSVAGAELNVALGLANRGIETSLLTRVGDDGFGRYLTSFVERHGVDVSGIEIDDDRATGLYVKEVGGATAAATDLGPGRSRMHYFRAGSASSVFSPAYLERPAVAELLAEADLIHTTGITPALSASAQKMTLELVARPRAGRLVSFDVNWRPALWRGREAEGFETMAVIASLCDVVLLGASESLIVYGTADPDELRQLLPAPRYLVVKNDGNAATAFDREHRVDVEAFEIEVVEAIGAGDAFAAGFLASLVSGKPLDECLLDAHRLAVVALGSVGDHVGSR
jgi:2-dehydro-3-deoxygluconokinase